MPDPSGALLDAPGSEASISEASPDTARLQARDMLAPPRVVCALAAPGLPATAKIFPRRVWTARSHSDGRVRELSTHSPGTLSWARARGLSGRQPGVWGPCCPRPARRCPTSRSRPLSVRGRLRRGQRHLPRAGSSARAARSGPSALTHARSR